MKLLKIFISIFLILMLTGCDRAINLTQNDYFRMINEVFADYDITYNKEDNYVNTVTNIALVIYNKRIPYTEIQINDLTQLSENCKYDLFFTSEYNNIAIALIWAGPDDYNTIWYYADDNNKKIIIKGLNKAVNWGETIQSSEIKEENSNYLILVPIWGRFSEGFYVNTGKTEQNYLDELYIEIRDNFTEIIKEASKHI